MNQDVLSFLNSKFPSLHRRTREIISCKWKILKKLKRREHLIDTNIYFVKSGALIIAAEQHEKELIMEFGYKGHCVFNMPFYLTEKPGKFYIEAIRATELIGISKKDFEQLKNEFPEVDKLWSKNLEYNLLRFAQRELEIYTGSAQQRFSALSRSQPELLQYIPKKYIATYLKISPETLSRISKILT